MSDTDNYRRAVTGAHKLLVGACALVFGLALYLSHVLSLDVPNAQLVQLEELERSSLSFALTKFLQKAMLSKLSAASQHKLRLSPKGPLSVWVINDPTNVNLGLEDNHRTISRLLAIHFPHTNLSFDTATLQQIQEALGTLVFIPDFTTGKYMSVLDKCIKDTEFNPDSMPRVIIKVTHKEPANDLEIPGPFRGHAVISLGSTEGVGRPCFSIDQFTPYSASELFSAIYPPENLHEGTLPLYQYHPVPDFMLGSDTWEELKDLTVSGARSEIRRMALAGQPSVPIIGASIPSGDLATAAPLVIILLQLILLSHVQAALRSPDARSSAGEWAWTGIYPGFENTLIILTSTTLIPCFVTISLTRVADSPVFEASIGGAFRLLLAFVTVTTGLRIMFCLRKLREA